MKRREFIRALGGAAVWPLAARAQQPMPVITILGGPTAISWATEVAAFHKGLNDVGYVEGRNLTIEGRWADGHYDRLPAMAADLVQRQVAVIVAFTTLAVRAAKAAHATIPIVFTTISDPVQIGLIASLSRPGANVTGATSLSVEVGPKLLELLHEVVPKANKIALLLNPTNINSVTASKTLQAAAVTLGLQLELLNATNETEIDAVFGALRQREKIDGLIVVRDAFFQSRIEQLAALSVRHAVPAVFQDRAYAAAGALMSYTSSNEELYRQAGLYTGRILKGEKPADLPVVQATKLELIINLKTAKALGLTVPLPLIGRADEVIE
jgi:putative tryptophan/tyrosine transport system substrate-binding protein